jgi:hypothetical protein
MDALDNNPAPAQPIWNTSLRYGAYLGGALIVFSLLMYLLDFNMMSLGGVALMYTSMLLLGGVFAVMAGRYQRDQLDGGYITFGKAFLIGLATVFIGMFISGIWNYILVTVIDPDYVAALKDQFVEAWGESMPPDALEEALKGFDKAGELGSALQSSLMGGAIFGAITGLISGAITKKQPEFK